MEHKELIEKFKSLKYQHLKKILDRGLSKLPENCKFNKVITLPNKYRLNICTFNFDSNFEIDLCYKVEHSKECNAFCPVRTKENLKEFFNSELMDPQIRATKYKDINIMLWCFPELQTQLEVTPVLKLSFLTKLKRAITEGYKTLFK